MTIELKWVSDPSAGLYVSVCAEAMRGPVKVRVRPESGLSKTWGVFGTR